MPSPGDRPAESLESVRNDIETHFPPSNLPGWTFQVSAATEYQKQQKKVLERKAENEVLIRQGKKPKPEIVTKKDTFDENTMQVRQSRIFEQNEGIDHYFMQVTGYIGPYYIQGPPRRVTKRYNTRTSAHLTRELVARTIELYKRRLFYQVSTVCSRSMVVVFQRRPSKSSIRFFPRME